MCIANLWMIPYHSLDVVKFYTMPVNFHLPINAPEEGNDSAVIYVDQITTSVESNVSMMH
jgi:hypothetical protein